ncbi:MAG TPA: MaoC family dehydratase [Acidimicrobiia bacterium]
MPGLDDLAGRSFGPFPIEASRARVLDLIAATGDDPDRWGTQVPPYFANAALFTVAPAFLGDEAVGRLTRSLIHSEQSFSWRRPLAVGEVMQVRGTVETLRARGPMNLATFSFEAGSDQGMWATGSSVFLLSSEAAGESEDESEPAVDLRPPVDPMPPAPLPPPGGPLEPVGVGASRADLVKYAAATGDWNPIHWDHQAAREAGLPGTIVHGLLMTAWMARAAARFSPGLHPLVEMRARFRSPLRPGRGAAVGGSVLSVDDDAAEIDLVLASGDDRIVTARVRVTR